MNFNEEGFCSGKRGIGHHIMDRNFEFGKKMLDRIAIVL